MARMECQVGVKEALIAQLLGELEVEKEEKKLLLETTLKRVNQLEHQRDVLKKALRPT